MILDLSFIVPVSLAIVAGIMAALDASKAPHHKRGVRLFEACVAWYFVLIYLLSWAATRSLLSQPDLLYFLRSGIATRFGVALLLVWLIDDIRSSNRKCQNNS